MSFTWIPIYSEIADRILAFENRQAELLELLKRMAAEELKVISLEDRDASGAPIPLAEIDPFTFFASFNRTGFTQGRQSIISRIKAEWRLSAEIPADFDGVPISNAQNSWAFSYSMHRNPSDVPTLWKAAREAVGKTWRTFDRSLFDEALNVRQTALTRLTVGLFWFNPRGFLSFDQNTEAFLRRRGVGLKVKRAAAYFQWVEAAVTKLGENFPKISHDAYLENNKLGDSKTGAVKGGGAQDPGAPEDSPEPPPPHTAYGKEDALADLFMGEGELDAILQRLERKKAVILQGPPGVGKTFVAKRLAFSLMNERDESRVEMVQFHPSYGYEDFVQGYRPAQAGGLQKRDGVFYRFAQLAERDAGRKYFFIIDEINRGNLAKIFGELLLLLESEKRGRDNAIPLMYSEDGERFSLPVNLYIIGTMNTADRSLAMVDYALRRRFAFASLEPEFGPSFADWLHRRGVQPRLVERIKSRVTALNKEIEDTRDLGRGFRIGHSYFCPATDCIPDDDWYLEIVESEIRPILEEYFDSPKKVTALVNSLIEE